MASMSCNGDSIGYNAAVEKFRDKEYPMLKGERRLSDLQ
jgi:hypothetical protein